MFLSWVKLDLLVSDSPVRFEGGRSRTFCLVVGPMFQESSPPRRACRFVRVALKRQQGDEPFLRVRLDDLLRCKRDYLLESEHKHIGTVVYLELMYL